MIHKLLDKLFGSHTVMSPRWESLLQVGSTKFMAKEPSVFVADDIFGASTPSEDCEFCFEKLWSQAIAPEEIEVRGLEFQPYADIGEVIVAKTAKILMAKELAKDPVARLLSLAHFASLDHVRKKFSLDADSAQSATLAAINLAVCGFGAVHVESLPDLPFWSTPIHIKWRTWWTGRRGRLSKPDLGYLLALISRRQGTSCDAWRDRVNRSVLKQIERAESYFSIHPPVLFDSLFDPRGNYDRATISSMLEGTDVQKCGAMTWIQNHKPKDKDWSSVLLTFLSHEDEFLVASAVLALSRTCEDHDEAISQIRLLLSHRSHAIAVAAYNALCAIHDEPEYLGRVSIELKKKGLLR